MIWADQFIVSGVKKVLDLLGNNYLVSLALKEYGKKRLKKKSYQEIFRFVEVFSKILRNTPEVKHELIVGDYRELSAVATDGISSSSFLKMVSGNARKHVKVALITGCSFGLLTEVRIAGKKKYVLTELGKVVKKEAEELKDNELYEVALISGLLFNTRAKLLTSSVLAHGCSSIKDIYANLLTSLRAYWHEMNDIANLAFKTVEEIIRVPEGIIKTKSGVRVSNTYVTLSVLSGLGVLSVQDRTVCPGPNAPTYLELLSTYHLKLLPETLYPILDLRERRLTPEQQETLNRWRMITMRVLHDDKKRKLIEVDLSRLYGLPLRLP
ncbi:MAG: hypothetical protein QXZ48_05800 [Zestosphaera sp.]